MHVSPSTIASIAPSRLRRFRVDHRDRDPHRLGLVGWAIVVAMGAVFVLLGGTGLEPDVDEARLGIAATEPFGPMGRAFGGWDASLWPGKVLFSRLLALLAEESPRGPWLIRWPSALAALGLVAIVARRVAEQLSSRAGLIAAACLFGSLGMIDRSTTFGIDTVIGLGVIAALDRILARGSDWVAGLWASFAVLCGGWPALAAIALPIVVLGRQGSTLSFRLLVLPCITLIGWSLWALRVATPEAWAAALTLPLTAGIAWTMAPKVLAAGLPALPFALLAAWPGVRLGWGRGGPLVLGWLQVAAASLLAGTLIPGMAPASGLPALVGLVLVAAASLDRLVVGMGTALPRRTFAGITLGIAIAWSIAATAAGIHIGASAPYYRPVAIALLILGPATGVLAVASTWERQSKLLASTILMVALGVKLVHAGIYSPELSYRSGQGPWGRAIGSWVPPDWPIYTVHRWSAELAFATERPFRQLADARLLNYEPKDRPLFVLLDSGEFDHWDATAPPLTKVREFTGPRGESRILARTAGRLTRPKKE